MSKEKPWKPWGDHPFVVLVFLIAALIPIIVFIKGNFSDNTSNSNSTLVIRVANESGDSISGAKVIILYSEGGLSQYTDVNGTVSISLSVPNLNIMRMIVEAEGFQIYEMQIQQVTIDVINVRLEKRRGEKSDVILRVVDGETESPISNAQIFSI